MDNSFSSFASSNDDDTLVLQPPAAITEEEQQQPPPLDALQVIRLFLQYCAHGQYAQAMTLLDPHVQVSYPGLPFIKTARQWYRATQQQQQHAWGGANNVRWAEAPQEGCCPGQVIRRCRAHGNNSGMIEVFQVDTADAVGSSSPRIMAMYLRKAPSKWMATTASGSGSFRSNSSKRLSSFRETRCEDQDDASKARERQRPASKPNRFF